MSDNRILNIINENDEIIGEASREEIYQKGLLHREIHVWFFTPQGEIIFQHRAKDKDTYPDMLDATVGGHVEIRDSYEKTAIKEMEEETGIIPDPSKLKFIKKMPGKSFDKMTELTNNTIRAQYAYLFDGDIKDLKIEEGKALGFEAWHIDKFHHLSEDEKKKFIPLILTDKFFELFKEGVELLGLKQ